jgi:enoyl-CoA hydratase
MILVAQKGSVATLTFNNPARHNAVSLEMWRAMAERLEEFAADPEVKVIVFTGAGGKAFASGADISKFEDERASAHAIGEYEAATDRVQRILLDYPKPTIAMIRGYCIGGGLHIAACCDMRICNESARFAIPAAKLGVGYAFPAIRRLLDLISPQFVYEILFTARQLSAVHALRVGLVNHVEADSEIEGFVAEMAETIAGNAPLTIRAVKRTVIEALREIPDIAACDGLVQECFASEDYREGRRAFMEKRKPVFTGK